jgi:hypothetical protein
MRNHLNFYKEMHRFGMETDQLPGVMGSAFPRDK